MGISWRLPVLSAAALLAGTAVGGGTVALWKNMGETEPTTIEAGTLDIDAGAQRWAETSADVAHPQNPIDPDTFLVRQGDSVTMTQSFTTHLQGDNMIGVIGVDWTASAVIPPGVVGTYEVLDDSGQAMGPTKPLGAEVSLDDSALTADNAGRQDSFSIAVTLDFADLSDRFGPDSVEQLSDLGTLNITLDQNRQSGEQP